MRKKVTRLKPHNVFGYVNFPSFNENIEVLQISNERADFIQDLTYSKLMYLLRGVLMFAIFNIDVADRNPKFKVCSSQDNSTYSENDPDDTQDNDSENTETNQTNNNLGPYTPESAYKPKKVQKSLMFTKEEGIIIDKLKDADNLSNKIYNLVFELSKLDLQVHRHSIAYLYRSLIESSTKYISQRQQKISFVAKQLETSVTNTLNYFGGIPKKDSPLSQKTIRTWRTIVNNQKLIDTLNEYIHEELPVDAYLLQETWYTMKGYIIACLTIQ